MVQADSSDSAGSSDGNDQPEITNGDEPPNHAQLTQEDLRTELAALDLLQSKRQPQWMRDFADHSRGWRRFFAELVGTFMLVLVAAGGGMLASTGFNIGRAAAVVAPGLMVMAVILSIGTISGAHLNPVVTIAFALRREFPWRRIPWYLLAQCAGAIAACLFLRAMFGDIGLIGATIPGHGVTNLHAMYLEIVLTFGLLTTILGTASHAQNVGPLAALAVGGYIALAGLWSSPISGASMNPFRSLGPDVITGKFGHLWVYLAGPTIGMVLAVGAAWILRGPGGEPEAIIAQGTLDSMIAQQPTTSAAKTTR